MRDHACRSHDVVNRRWLGEWVRGSVESPRLGTENTSWTRRNWQQVVTLAVGVSADEVVYRSKPLVRVSSAGLVT